MTVATVRHARAQGLGSLEELLYEGTTLRNLDLPPDVRLDWFAQALEHHITTSPIYGALADRRGFTSRSVLETGSLDEVPLLPASIFKRRKVTSGSTGAVQLTKSSGTQGAVSIVPRDQPTLERFVGSVIFGVRDLFELSEAREVFVLGPHPDEADDIWFSYVLTLVGLLHETRFAVADGVLNHDDLFQQLANLAPGTKPAVVGPPSLLVDFLAWMSERDLSLNLGDREPFVLTAGGWKKRTDEQVSRDDLLQLVNTHLGVPANGVRDTYNAVELNTVVFECEQAEKHIPPWLEVQARRPSDMSIAEDGDLGLLAFLDATAASYPAFYLSDDLGRVSDTKQVCPCGRPGPVLEISRRVQSAEQRGCGLSLNRYARSTRDRNVEAEHDDD